jgi:hypothetical protein
VTTTKKKGNAEAQKSLRAQSEREEAERRSFQPKELLKRVVRATWKKKEGAGGEMSGSVESRKGGQKQPGKCELCTKMKELEESCAWSEVEWRRVE